VIKFQLNSFKWSLLLLVSSVLLASCGGDVIEVESAKIKTYRYYPTGNPDLPVNVADPLEPSLVLVGGGTDVDASFRWMIDRAGIRTGTGGRIVVIRASGEDGYNEYLYYSNGDNGTSLNGLVDDWVGGAALGLSSVETLVIPDRASANDPAVLAVVARAQAIFIAGGDQSNYIKYWKNTRLHGTLVALMSRNVPFGGTSAGLAILGQYDFSALYDTISSVDAMGNPYNTNLTLDPADPADPTGIRLLTEGGLITPKSLANVITDSHMGPLNTDMDSRDRMGRFLTFIARLIAPTASGGCPGGVLQYQQARGIGVSPETALLVSGDGVRAPFTGKRVTNPTNKTDPASAVYFVSASQPPSVCAANKPLTFKQLKVQKIFAETDVFNLSTWLRQGGTESTLDVDAGSLSASMGSVY